MRHMSMLGTLCAIALIGCSNILGVGGPQVSVSLEARQGLTAGAKLRADIGGQVIQLAPTTGVAPRTSAEVRGSRYGEVPVSVTLLGASGDTLAAIGFTQRFERGHNHWIAAIVGDRRPIGPCIGNLAVVPVLATMLETSPDTLFVMHGSIPKNAIC